MIKKYKSQTIKKTFFSLHDFNKDREKNNRDSIEYQFWKRVEKMELDQCWNWRSVTNQEGYGKLYVDGKEVLAHQFSWEFLNGKLPNNLFICHRCKNKLCVNPAHLFLHSDNENYKKIHIKNWIKSVKLNKYKVLAIRDLHIINKLTIQDLAIVFKLKKIVIVRVLNEKLWKFLY